MKRFSTKKQALAGLDEAGRGSLYGPLFAGACILPKRVASHIILKDSKKMSHPQRLKSFEWLQKYAICGVGEASAQEIDDLGLIKALNLAMQRAVDQLSLQPDLLLIDGRDTLNFTIESISIVGGDHLYKEIAAASILAKVSRDLAMQEYDRMDPGYALKDHKGYGTLQHRTLLKEKGLSPRHRRSFVCK